MVTTHVGFQTGRTNEPGPIGYLLARGDFGVTVFFLLSGFLLYRPMLHALRAPSIGTYLRRRGLRVLPVYWLAVVGAMLILPENDGAGGSTWTSQLTLTQVYNEDLPAGLTQMWSLSTEVAFYATLPLFALAVRGLRRRAGQVVGGSVDLGALALLVVLGVTFTAAAYTGALPTSAHLWLPAYADWFALGMGLAVLHTRLATDPRHRWSRVVEDLSRAPGTCLAIGGLLFLLAATPLGGPKLLETATVWQALAKHILYGAGALFLLFPTVFTPAGGSRWSRLLSSRPLHWAGQVSYSVFALHLIVLHLVFTSLGHPPFTGHFGKVWLVTVAASLAVASLSYLLVERPAQRRPGSHRA